MLRGAVFIIAVALAWDIATHWFGWRTAFGLWPVPDGTPWTYQLWSGFVPALTVLSLLGSAIALFRHVNCHVHGCPRVGRFAVAGGQFKVCQRHHPDAAVATRKLTVHHIRAMHLDHHRKGTRSS